MGKFNLSDAAKAVLLGEDSKSTFDANIKSKQSQRGGEKAPHGEVGKDKLSTSTVSGQQDAGEIGQSPEEIGDNLPDYTKGTPSATPPGATPPVGSEKDGVGITKPQGQPQETQGRSEIKDPKEYSATSYEAIRDRVKYSAPGQTFEKNPGATFQTYGEDIEAMLQGENLSEEFKTKAATIYEAAVVARVQAIAEEVEQQLSEEFETAVETIKEELASKVDEYLNYFTEEWIKENEIAIEKGLRAEIVEDFISKLRNLFVESYIDIPEDKVDLVGELSEKVDELEAQVNEEIQKNIELKKAINEHKKIEAVHAVCEGLTQTQVEKIKSLAEGVDFTTDEEFAGKLATIKESYFPNPAKTADASAFAEESVLTEEDHKETSKIVTDPLMNKYAQAISKTVLK